MIQRIQSVYLLISLISLSIISFGTTFFTGIIENGTWIFTAHSLEKRMTNNELDKINNMPIYLIFLAVALLCLITIFMYKNLRNQLKLARLTAVLYVFAVGIVWVNFILLNSQVKSISIGLGFYLLHIGLITSFLASRGIKKDRNLIDSVNRLR